MLLFFIWEKTMAKPNPTFTLLKLKGKRNFCLNLKCRQKYEYFTRVFRIYL